jgi:hypothetical protein
MTTPRWLSEREDRAWRAYRRMQVSVGISVPPAEQPDDFLDYLNDVVVPSTSQLPRS